MARRSPIHLLGYPEGTDVGAMEGWEHPSSDRAPFDRSHSSVNGILAKSGRIKPLERRRSKLALTLAEREEISRCVVAGRSIRAIAREFGRAPSTIRCWDQSAAIVPVGRTPEQRWREQLLD